MSDEASLPEEESIESRIRPADENEMPEPILIEEVLPAEKEEVEPIQLVEDEEEHDEERAKRVVKQSAKSSLQHAHAEFKRPLNVNGRGATRCKLFHSRIALDPLDSMETRINDWLDEDDIEVKHVGHVLGVMEGKSPRPNMVVVVWY